MQVLSQYQIHIKLISRIGVPYSTPFNYLAYTVYKDDSG